MKQIVKNETYKKELKVYNSIQIELIEQICNNNVDEWIGKHAESFSNFYKQAILTCEEEIVIEVIIERYKEYCKGT